MTLRSSANSVVNQLLNRIASHRISEDTEQPTSVEVSKDPTKASFQQVSMLGIGQLSSRSKGSGGSRPLWFPFRRKK